RRQIYLIFKEAITNVARHSHASHARVEVKIEREVLFLTVDDDGRGFDEETLVDGNGLSSIRTRAAGLDGRGELCTRPGEGTRWTVIVSLVRRKKSDRRRARQY